MLRSFARRFGFAYLILYFFPPLPEMAWTEFLTETVANAWEHAGALLGRTVLGLPPDQLQIVPSGSGDRLVNYLAALAMMIAALGIAIVWHTVDGRRPRAADAHPVEASPTWVYTYARYALAFTMLGYGMSKVIPVQFGELWLDRLLQPIGHTSPMGLLWSFMSASPGYALFGGLGEVVGAVLLFWRRTTLAGALILAAILANVVALNFCYDVPVKLYSSHLLALSLFLIHPHARSLASALLGPGAEDNRHRALAAVKVLLVTAVCVLSFTDQRAAYRDDHETRTKGPLYGVYDVMSYRVNAREVPPSLAEPERWRRLVVSGVYGGSIRLMNDTLFRVSFEMDTTKRTLEVRARGDSATRYELSYTPDRDYRLRLDGLAGRDSLHVTLQRLPDPKFLLQTRGFHWVNDQPFNR